MPKSKAEALYKQYTQFEKRFGDQNEIETVVTAKRRVQYEEVSVAYDSYIVIILLIVEMNIANKRESTQL
jgi:hypothetical protein